MDKLTCYKKLFEIRDVYKEDVSQYLQKLAGSSTPDKSIIQFIESYENDPSTTLNEEVVRSIYNRRHKNPLYKSLVNESASDYDKIITLSSYVTRVLIESKDMNKSAKNKLLNEMQLPMVVEALSSYLDGDEATALNSFDKIRSMIKSIISEDKYDS